MNPYNANEELGAQVLDVLLKVRPYLTDDEMHALCYATGVQIETSAQQILRKHREAQQAELRG